MTKTWMWAAKVPPVPLPKKNEEKQDNDCGVHCQTQYGDLQLTPEEHTTKLTEHFSNMVLRDRGIFDSRKFEYPSWLHDDIEFRQWSPNLVDLLVKSGSKLDTQNKVYRVGIHAL